jgi:DNA-binding Lrp family transcriptional regulator
MMKDPNISEYAKTLGITPDWLKKKMRSLKVTGYKDGRSVRLSPNDQAKIKISFDGRKPEYIDTRTSEREYPNPDTLTPESDFYSSGVAIAPIVETVVIDPLPVMRFEPLTFQTEDHSLNIQSLHGSIEDLHSRHEANFDAFEKTMIANAAQRGLAVGLAVGQAYLASRDHATTITLGKSVGGGA